MKHFRLAAEHRRRLFLALPWLLLLAALYFLWQLDARVTALENELQTVRSDTPGQPPARLTNLEFIINAHSEQLKKTERDIYRLQSAQTDLDWRLRKLYWQEPQNRE
ncbi:MAG: hypothetical protein MR209_04350 [Veillonellaceae bacterium]|nr:hypothetical protein [Veillonellaceae bacterium]